MRCKLRPLVRRKARAPFCLGAASERAEEPRWLPIRIALLVAVVGSTLAAGAPGAAFAHEEATSTVQGHVEEDFVAHSPAEERRLERRTSAVTASDADAAAATVTGDESQVGQWGPVVDWPVVGVYVALLPNGKVLAFDSVADNGADTSESTTTPAPRCGTPPPAHRRR